MNYLKKEFRLFSLFLLIPIGGLVFYGIFVAQSPEDIALLFQHLSFKGGWGGGELQNSFFEIYSPIGYLLAFIGICLISLNQKMNKRYLIYLFWPICVLASMAVYKITGISFLSPYQRNWIYLAISLPFLSALGLNYLIEIIKSFNAKTKKTYVNIALTILITLVLVLSFWSYSKLPEQSKLNPLIDEKDYEDIVFLSGLEKGAVIADLGKSSAIYPISGQKPIAIMYFYGDPRENENFFKAGDCNYKKEIIQKYNIRYVLSEEKIDCGWKIIRSENSYIYQI